MHDVQMAKYYTHMAIKVYFLSFFMSNRSTIWPVCTMYHLFSILGMVWNDILVTEIYKPFLSN